MIEELHEEMAQLHKYQEILDNLIKPEDKSSTEKLLSEVRNTGIFDKEKKHRYWVDEEDKNCFMVHARALTITRGDDSRYWRWYPVNITSRVSVDAAELLDICWLEVQGAFETKYLTPGTQYEVSFVIRLKDPKYGWEDHVDFSLTLPQNEMKTCKCDLRKLPRGRWSFLRVGDFKSSAEQSGRMDFMLRQTVSKWKKGLDILAVDISPKF